MADFLEFCKAANCLQQLGVHGPPIERDFWDDAEGLSSFLVCTRID